jgi:hypothetical protein
MAQNGRRRRDEFFPGKMRERFYNPGLFSSPGVRGAFS